MFNFFAPLVYFCAATLGVVLLLKKPFGKSLPIVLFSSPLLLFLSQLIFGTFSVGFYLCVAFAVFSVVFAVVKSIKSGSEEIRKNFFSVGLIAFLVIYLIVAIYDFRRGFSVWDEFSHWGMMLKEMVRLDKFYFVDASNLLVHKDYPPILQLFELFWLKLCGGNFSDNLALCAVHTIELSLIIPFVLEKTFDKKNTAKTLVMTVCSCVALVLIVLLFDLHGVIHTIYNDYLLALATVYLLIAVYSSKKISYFEILEISLGGSFVLLLKQMGLPLYLMVLCFLFGTILVRGKFHLKKLFKEIGWKKLAISLVAILIPFVLWFIWGKLTANVAHQFDYSDLSISNLPGILTGTSGESWQRFTIKKYLIAFGTENISTNLLPLTFLQAVILSLSLFYIVYKKNSETLNKKETIFLGLLLLIGAIGYSGAMLILYVFSFGEYEGPMLASYERYMGTFAIIMFGIVLAIFVREAFKQNQIKYIAGVTCALAILAGPTSYSRLYPNPTGTAHKDVQKVAEFALENTEPESKIFVEYGDSLGFFYYFQYFANSRRVNSYLYTWPTGEDIDSEAFYEENVAPKISEYDYLLIHDFNDAFLDSYCSIVCPTEYDTLYRIEKANGEIHFEKIGTPES